MKQGLYTIKENTKIADGIWKMVLEGDGTAVTAPGQFVDLKLDGRFLRRPISVHDADEGSITIIYKVLGHGTEDMTRYEPGKQLDVIAGLGNGFDSCRWGRFPATTSSAKSCRREPSPTTTRPLLVGGGVGIPPLYLLAKKLIAAGKPVQVVLGFNTKADLFCVEEFQALGCGVRIASADGSVGVKGFVTDALPDSGTYDCFYTCGPLPMLKALDKTIPAGVPGQLSFEERMGCGFGACMGCTVPVKGGYKRICKDGPVLDREEIVWQA
ncbi:MAG: dihydroorotate dehydrogenase electron transfer subunit [Firmicutes bacterium]|nr:dihydroorotate dehydrogenase electron transfer subunit [Bacillota bacterium]